MSDGPDEIHLNPPPTRGKAARDVRSEELRVEALRAAVSGNGANFNSLTVLQRAAAFEKFLVTGEISEPTDRSWTSTANPNV
jgi:hypothetical protein